MTRVSIEGENWLIDGVPTHRGREYRGTSIEGLLMNSRMANGLFDDENPNTRHLWSYPDTNVWDADRNTDELIQMLPVYRSHGLDAICVNLQGASPLGYYRSDEESFKDLMQRVHARQPGAHRNQIWADLPDVTSQPWNSGALNPDGSMKSDFLSRAERLLKAVDEAGLVAVLGIFYFGQDERVGDEQGVKTAVRNVCEWVLATGLENVVIEVNNECDIPRYEHEILQPPRVHELIELAKLVQSDAKRLLVGTSFTRRMTPPDPVISASDFILLHGNGITDPPEIGEKVRAVRESNAYRGQPIAFNEDDHFDFDKPVNNFTVALANRAGWGFFGPGPGAGGRPAYGDYSAGYQNPPINWGLNDDRKKGFFRMLSEVTGQSPCIH